MVIPGVLRGRLVSPRVTKWPLGCQKCPFSKSLVLQSKTTHLELVGASGGHASRTRRQLSAFKGPLGCLGRPQGGTNEVLWQAIKCPTGPKRRQMVHPLFRDPNKIKTSNRSSCRSFSQNIKDFRRSFRANRSRGLTQPKIPLHLYAVFVFDQPNHSRGVTKMTQNGTSKASSKSRKLNRSSCLSFS